VSEASANLRASAFCAEIVTLMTLKLKRETASTPKVKLLGKGIQKLEAELKK